MRRNTGPDHDDYVHRGFGIFAGLILIGVVIGALYKAFTAYPGKSKKLVVTLAIGALIIAFCYGACYVLGYLSYHLPEQVEKWK